MLTLGRHPGENTVQSMLTLGRHPGENTVQSMLTLGRHPGENPVNVVNVLLDNNDEKTGEKPATKRQPRKAFSIDFSASLPSGAFASVKVRLYIIC